MENLDYAGIAALILAVFTIVSALLTRKETKAKVDADASLTYEEAATKASERNLKLQASIDNQDKRIKGLEERIIQLEAENRRIPILETQVQELQSENRALCEQIKHLEAALREAGQ